MLHGSRQRKTSWVSQAALGSLSIRHRRVTATSGVLAVSSPSEASAPRQQQAAAQEGLNQYVRCFHECRLVPLVVNRPCFCASCIFSFHWVGEIRLPALPPGRGYDSYLQHIGVALRRLPALLPSLLLAPILPVEPALVSR